MREVSLTTLALDDVTGPHPALLPAVVPAPGRLPTQHGYGEGVRPVAGGRRVGQLLQDPVPSGPAGVREQGHVLVMSVSASGIGSCSKNHW